MELVFIYNNLKVSPFLPYDRPVDGCELVTYDTESYMKASLWDIGDDVGLYDGLYTVRGQLWRIHKFEALHTLSELFCEQSGLTKQRKITVTISVDDIVTTVQAVTFYLTSVKKTYKLVEDEVWSVKRN